MVTGEIESFHRLMVTDSLSFFISRSAVHNSFLPFSIELQINIGLVVSMQTFYFGGRFNLFDEFSRWQTPMKK